MTTDISFILETDLTPEQKTQIAYLNQEAFGDVPLEEVQENFIAIPYARVLAYEGTNLVGTLQLFQRHVTFSHVTFLLGGVGGVCVAKSHRRRGIAQQMIERALSVLREAGCAVACLNTEPNEPAFGLYKKMGFQLMPRAVSFENNKGQIVHDDGTMFVPLTSLEVFDLLMNSDDTFHYGVGYW